MFYNKKKIEDALKAFKKGELIIVVDDDARENEGDLIVAAEFCTKEQMAFIIRHSSGIICVPLTEERAKELELPPMVEINSSAYHTSFTVSVDCKKGTTTGISAYERALTSRKLADKASVTDDFVKPGHIFPLTAHPGGILKRSGHTEAAVDLCRLCDLTPVAVIGELMNDDGTVQHNEQLDIFAQQHNIPIITIADLIAYRQNTERLVNLIAEDQKYINNKEISIYEYDILENIYKVIMTKEIKENSIISLYISPRQISERELEALINKYTNLICIIYEENSVLYEQHSQAVARNITWRKYGAIKQILAELPFHNYAIVSTHNAEELKTYEGIIKAYGK